MLLSARAAAPIETVVFVFIVSPDAPCTGELIDGCAGRGLIRNIVCAPIRWVRRLWRERMERATAVDARGQAAGGAPMRVGMLAVAGNVSILKRSRAANRLGRRSLRWRMPAAISARSRSTRRRRRRARSRNRAAPRTRGYRASREAASGAYAAVQTAPTRVYLRLTKPGDRTAVQVADLKRRNGSLAARTAARAMPRALNRSTAAARVRSSP
ncbi:MAG: hypothetical protein IH603_24805 [Burkholderia vietnamiensis]|nr:hypothetical protein [Burkholderia vietnamiensis]